MPQDALHINRLISELSSALVGGQINRISQVDKDELTFIVYNNFHTQKLIISTNASNARVCVSSREKEPLAVSPNFCVLLKKHLLGGEILSICQHEFERICEIEILCKTEFSSAKRTLIAEIMGKYSNLILVENGIILGALKTTSLENSHRILFAGAKYTYPTPQDKLSPFDEEAIKKREEDFFSLGKERSEENVATFLFENVQGIALPTAREMAKRKKENLSVFVKDFCLRKDEPHILVQNGKIKDFFAFFVEGGTPVSTLMEGEDRYYTAREEEKVFSEKKLRLLSIVRGLLKKQNKAKADILLRLHEAENANENRIKGELLTANLYAIKEGSTSCKLTNWYSEEGEEVEIPLDSTLSPSQNAQRYFKLYSKQKRTKEALLPRLKKAEEEEGYIGSILFSIERAETLFDLAEIETELVELSLIPAPKRRVAKKKTVPYRVYEKDGFTILAGRNNLQNDRLLKESDGEDIWLHAQKYHSAFLMIRAEGKTPTDEVILYAAEICAYYSTGKGADKVPVDYTLRKHVKKPPKSKAGFVTYSGQKTVMVAPKLHLEK